MLCAMPCHAMLCHGMRFYVTQFPKVSEVVLYPQRHAKTQHFKSKVSGQFFSQATAPCLSVHLDDKNTLPLFHWRDTSIGFGPPRAPHAHT